MSQEQPARGADTAAGANEPSTSSAGINVNEPQLFVPSFLMPSNNLMLYYLLPNVIKRRCRDLRALSSEYLRLDRYYFEKRREITGRHLDLIKASQEDLNSKIDFDDIDDNHLGLPFPYTDIDKFEKKDPVEVILTKANQLRDYVEDNPDLRMQPMSFSLFKTNEMKKLLFDCENKCNEILTHLANIDYQIFEYEQAAKSYFKEMDVVMTKYNAQLSLFYRIRLSLIYGNELFTRKQLVRILRDTFNKNLIDEDEGESAGQGAGGEGKDDKDESGFDEAAADEKKKESGPSQDIDPAPPRASKSMKEQAINLTKPRQPRLRFKIDKEHLRKAPEDSESSDDDANLVDPNNTRLERIYHQTYSVKYDKEEESYYENKYKALPDFWYNTLLIILDNQNTSVLQVRDKDLLKYLFDIQYYFDIERTEDPATSCESHFSQLLLFFFHENPFFTNKILSKTIVIDNNIIGARKMDLDGLKVKKILGCEIDWKEGKNLLQNNDKSFFKFFLNSTGKRQLSPPPPPPRPSPPPLRGSPRASSAMASSSLLMSSPYYAYGPVRGRSTVPGSSSFPSSPYKYWPQARLDPVIISPRHIPWPPQVTRQAQPPAPRPVPAFDINFDYKLFALFRDFIVPHGYIAYSRCNLLNDDFKKDKAIEKHIKNIFR